MAYKNSNVLAEKKSSNYLREFFKKNPFLDTFHIELTSRCNERCIHCYIPHEKKNRDIDSSLMFDALEQCKSMGVLTLVFSGGEPMLHPKFCDFLQYAKDLDMNVTVLSNLTLLNEEIVNCLQYKHASCVNVSLYSMNSDIHDSITKMRGSFLKTHSNIMRLIENNVPVQINLPIMKQNKDSFCDVIEWGQSNKCSVIVDYLIMARYDHSTDNLVNRLSSNELEDVILKQIQHDVVFQNNIKAGSMEENIQPSDIDPESNVCGVGMSTLCMVASGEVYPCAGWQRNICGNLNNQSLKSIWESSPQINYLRGIRQKDFAKCMECLDYDYCLMCMSRNSNEDSNGDIFNIPSLTCDAAKIQHKIIDEYRQR